MSGRLEPRVERAVSAQYYTAVIYVEAEATERPEVQRVLEAGKFGTDSARSMLRLSVGVGGVEVLSSRVAAWPRCPLRRHRIRDGCAQRRWAAAGRSFVEDVASAWLRVVLAPGRTP
ncbi:hypothetical protein AB0A81_37045 [Streptomyces flaveolus]|uniref:Uncharacterized protein n=1 Tax=Streptomyces flaveolus TaxID=67297 RepID=A0ABV1VKQ9_9ACTN